MLENTLDGFIRGICGKCNLKPFIYQSFRIPVFLDELILGTLLADIDGDFDPVLFHPCRIGYQSIL